MPPGPGEKKRRKKKSTAPPVRPTLSLPADNSPISFPGGADWAETTSYRLLGLQFERHLNWDRQHSRTYTATASKFNALRFHRCGLISGMPISRQLQVRKALLQWYGLSILIPPPAAIEKMDSFLHLSGCGILGYQATSTSRLLVATYTASTSTTAVVLKEHLRFYLHGDCHVSWRTPSSTVNQSLPLMKALKAEHFSHVSAGTPKADRLPNYVSDVAGLLAANPTSPLRHGLADFHVNWGFETKSLLRPFVAGTTYYEYKTIFGSKSIAADHKLGPLPPRLNGSEKTALSHMCGFHCPPARFAPGSRPAPLSYVGPGLPCLLSMGTSKIYTATANAQLGHRALSLWPFLPHDVTVFPHVPRATPIPSGTLPPPTGSNINAHRGCPLCGMNDSIYHIFGECTHPSMIIAQNSCLADARKKLVPYLFRTLQSLSRQPSDGLAPLDRHIVDAQEAAIASLDVLQPGAANVNERGHLLYRLATANPWPEYAAQPGHHLIAGLGSFFDTCIASSWSLRSLSTFWLSWSEIALQKLAAARWATIAAEAASPTLPRPPPWSPPLPPPLPTSPPQPPLPHEPLHPPPPPASVASGPRYAAKPCARQTVSRYWLSQCNISALTGLLAAAKLDPSLADALHAATSLTPPPKRGTGTKAWHLSVLSAMRLSPNQLASLQEHAPTALTPTVALDTQRLMRTPARASPPRALA